MHESCFTIKLLVCSSVISKQLLKITGFCAKKQTPENVFGLRNHSSLLTKKVYLTTSFNVCYFLVEKMITRKPVPIL